LDKILECNIRNYSIYFKDDLLFSYFEYHGCDLKSDWKKMDSHAKTPGMVGCHAADAGTLVHAERG